MTKAQFLREALYAIELAESKLLVWGIVDGFLTSSNLFEILDPVIDEAMEGGFSDYYSYEDVISDLVDLKLIHKNPNIAEPHYRSRMAEGLRLLFRLRQIFPKHKENDDWQQARTLVSDYRFVLRRRKYPKRDLEIAVVLERLSKSIGDPLLGAAVASLLETRGDSFRIASFQERGLLRVLDSLKARRSSGTLVSAGTGSGKTLAFYLPALSWIAKKKVEDGRNARSWVKCLAIYPRTELLRDQFSEVFKEARRLDSFLIGESITKLRIGALFSGTPYSAADLTRPRKGKYIWNRLDRGFECSFLTCPNELCRGRLIWQYEDVDANLERLVCTQCDATIDSDEITLTRHSLQKSPPDVLFSTTEMMNQRMSDPRSRHLFGLRPEARKPPDIVLLDEVHTYAGFHGAQVAYLLRRWRKLVNSPVHFVGLSATIREGQSFFSGLLGLREYTIEEITPKQKELEFEGAEYMVALQGDPVSRTSLLSTTIQTSMLMSRILDNRLAETSDGMFGSRVFAFTDDIDVNNRLYHSLLDAEGRDSSTTSPDAVRHPNGGLSFLRDSGSKIRDEHGQDWWMPRDVGHLLSDRKQIGRTSSQDPGVGFDSDVIIATASLEVGFNDPTVGAVIQHKAPRESAQFLQRKGRAGRSREMRPWTVVILSDYGRDRIAYQAYDQLFDPELRPRNLPLSSRYVQRMQGVYTLIDYLSKDRNLGDALWPWRILSGDESKGRSRVLAKLDEILNNPSETDSFCRFSADALNVSEEDMLSILWGHPRPVLTAAIPTAARRLQSNWQSVEREGGDYKVNNSPLPDFAPSNLFSDLNLPEVMIRLPNSSDPEIMPIMQAMRTFATGRVSRRFGTRGAWVRHWLAPEVIDASIDQSLPVDEILDGNDLGHWKIIDAGETLEYRVYRAHAIKVTEPSGTILDTSNAFLEWRTQIVPSISGPKEYPPHSTPWKKYVRFMQSFTHFEKAPVEFRRVALRSNANIRYKDGSSVRKVFSFSQTGEKIGLGFSLSVDALKFSLELPANVDVLQRQLSPEAWRALRTTRFFETVREELTVVDNPFARQWLATIYFSALSYQALSSNISLEDANVLLERGEEVVPLVEVLDAIFQSSAIQDEAVDQADTIIEQDQLRQELEGLLRNPEVIKALRKFAVELWCPVTEGWLPWLLEKMKSTIGLAFLKAMDDLCPDVETDQLLLDVNYYEECDTVTRGHDLWISEQSPGGMGLIEVFLREYAKDPRRFYKLVTAALRPNGYEQTDFQLGEVLSGLVGASSDKQLRESVEQYRLASGLELQAIFDDLRRILAESGMSISHGLVSTLMNRIIRSGSSPETDKFLFESLNSWVDGEDRLGVELEARTIAYWLSQREDIDHVLHGLGIPIPPTHNRAVWRFNAIYGLFWPRGSATRSVELSSYNPFYQLPTPERLLVFDLIENPQERIFVSDEIEWQNRCMEVLSSHGTVTLVCQRTESKELANVVNFLTTNAIDSDYLSVFASIETIRRIRDQYEIDAVVLEFSQ